MWSTRADRERFERQAAEADAYRRLRAREITVEEYDAIVAPLRRTIKTGGFDPDPNADLED